LTSPLRCARVGRPYDKLPPHSLRLPGARHQEAKTPDAGSRIFAFPCPRQPARRCGGPHERGCGRRGPTLRCERDLSIEALALSAGMHPTYLGRVERGACNPSLGKLGALARALGVSLGEVAAIAEGQRGSGTVSSVLSLRSGHVRAGDVQGGTRGTG